MTILETSVSSQTLAQRMAQGRIPVPEALRFGMILAEALRKVHDAGQVHGGVSPNCVRVTHTSLELFPAPSSGSVTPYTAPEVVQGSPADSRSDIFSFGTILYEMLTGRAAFSGEGQALLSALTTAAPAASGSPAVDRVVASCLAKNPAARWQRMQKLLLELKLLAVAVQRAETPARRETPDPTPVLRAEMQQLESRLAVRLADCDSGIERVNVQISQVEQAVRESAAGLTRVEQALGERIAQFERTAADALGRMEKAVNDRISTVELALKSAAGVDRVAQVEQAATAAEIRLNGLEGAVTALRQDTAALRESVSEDLSMFDKSLKSQNVAIESARTAMAQTDDLVERVVEALESLQSVVLEHSDDRELAAV